MNEAVRPLDQTPTPLIEEGATRLKATVKCRSCRAPIALVRTPKRTTLALDPEPVEQGSVAVIDGLAVPSSRSGLLYRRHSCARKCPAREPMSQR